MYSKHRLITNYFIKTAEGINLIIFYPCFQLAKSYFDIICIIFTYFQSSVLYIL